MSVGHFDFLDFASQELGALRYHKRLACGWWLTLEARRFCIPYPFKVCKLKRGDFEYIKGLFKIVKPNKSELTLIRPYIS